MTKGVIHFHFLSPSSTKLSQDWSVSSLGEAYTLMIIHWKIKGQERTRPDKSPRTQDFEMAYEHIKNLYI